VFQSLLKFKMAFPTWKSSPYSIAAVNLGKNVALAVVAIAILKTVAKVIHAYIGLWADSPQLQDTSKPTPAELRALAQPHKLLEFQRLRTEEANAHAATLQRFAALFASKQFSREQLTAAISTTRSAHAGVSGLSNQQQKLLIILEKAVTPDADAGVIMAAATDAVQAAQLEQEQLVLLKDATLPVVDVGDVEQRQLRLDGRRGT